MEIYRAVAEVPPARIWDGVLARVVNGERVTVGFVLRGSITMVIAGESRELGVGGTYTITSQVPHSAKAGAGGASVVDVFAPIRADWERAPREKAFPGKWPETKR